MSWYAELANLRFRAVKSTMSPWWGSAPETWPPAYPMVPDCAARVSSKKVEESRVTEHSPPWPKQGPASYFPSIETKYGRSIADWQKIVADCGIEKHMEIVNYLKSEYGMGHGHANALVGWTLAGNTAVP